ncbi:hypothetical protein [Enterococcus caccae]|uniref:Uncharacterized protein n=1 Tax=Enterococcus caccae ATCC BAA-1240 TaxID=1158612 RepID=R3WT03_9ENTE|nr:hypothetical protein [Enterococcus caccae]EOL50517.1 hypothetical protein UC7_00290 [Enterococcus caccae ATCC BAA-1240]EOT59267.1 hypothetical protein I580_02299 [Enterococcus caccae ATCC BAA-1240]OJG26679.1 hypothetical protein RU98_GL000469 [Enterococcus caccae]
MENVTISKGKVRDTTTIVSLGMLAYRIFPDTACVNIQLLNGNQEECTIPLKNGEVFMLRGVKLCLDVKE